MTIIKFTPKQREYQAAILSSNVSVALAHAAVYIGDRGLTAKMYNDKELYQSLKDAMDALSKAHQLITDVLLAEYPELEGTFTAFDPDDYTLQ